MRLAGALLGTVLSRFYFFRALQGHFSSLFCHFFVSGDTLINLLILRLIATTSDKVESIFTKNGWNKLQKSLDKFIKGSFCGLANLEIATGVQGKVLSYMSFGLPVLCSKKTANNFNNNVISYNGEDELIAKIKKLKNERKLSNQISKKSLSFVNKFTWSKVQKEYLKLVKG